MGVDDAVAGVEIDFGIDLDEDGALATGKALEISQDSGGEAGIPPIQAWASGDIEDGERADGAFENLCGGDGIRPDRSFETCQV